MRTEHQTGAAVPVPSSTDTPTWLLALRAAESKFASDIRILDLRELGTFADFFLICNGTNKPQIQAIWDEIAKQMKMVAGEMPIAVEGYENAEWILGDFGDLIIHVFTPEKRDYYDLERLWRPATVVPLPEPEKPFSN
ncbi:MAG: ribosome silencing factor [Bryobacteraceae bacterium]|nr:ribosome silencing factor [Bryobacteraceae bacterium]